MSWPVRVHHVKTKPAPRQEVKMSPEWYHARGLAVGSLDTTIETGSASVQLTIQVDDPAAIQPIFEAWSEGRAFIIGIEP